MVNKNNISRKKKIRKYVGISNKDNGYWDKRKGVRIHGDKFKHFITKSIIYYILRKNKHEVRTEVLIGSYQADIIDATTGLIYEVETNLNDNVKKMKKRKYLKIDTAVGQFIDVSLEDIVFFDIAEMPDNIIELKKWC